MVRKQGLAIVAAACAVLAGGGQSTWASGPAAPADTAPAGTRAPLLMDDAAGPSSAGPSASGTPTTSAAAVAPGTAPAATPAVNPLMGALTSLGVGKGLSDAGFSITGYVEGGYTFDFSAPTGNVLDDRAFDTRHNSVLLDQVEFNVSRTVDYGKPIDFGVELEQIYGTDSAFIHANGLSLLSNGKIAGPFAGTGTTSTIAPRAQYDPTQANFVISSNALGKGHRLRGRQVRHAARGRADRPRTRRLRPTPSTATA